MFIARLLSRTIRVEEDLVHKPQLIAQRRSARTTANQELILSICRDADVIHGIPRCEQFCSVVAQA
jgi:hypothetical protein